MPKVKTNGSEIFYQERGSGQPLILLMGLGADGDVWEQHVQAYEQHFRCILIDNRGAGRSDHPQGPYTTRMMADDTAAVMKAIGIEKAHVAGISMGSAIAQELALAYPELIQSLSLHCSWAKCDPYSARLFETLRSMIATAEPVAFTRLLQAIIFSPEYHENHIDDLLLRESSLNLYPMPIHAFQAQCDACLTHDTHGKLSAIKAPTLLTVGTKDIFTPEHFTRAIAEEIPHAEISIFAGSGHTHHWDRLELFNRITLDFMLKESL